jgi:Leucine-rich repeat (LRR) protein
VLVKNIFIFRQDFTICSHKSLNTEAENLKIRPNFLNNTTVIRAADIKVLNINFAPSTHIFSGIGETFSNLYYLYVEDQSIKFVERSDFAGLMKLERLGLNGNQIEILPEDVFWNLPNLKELKLSNNKIKKLPVNIFKNLKKLETISLSDNKIEHLPRSLFTNNLEIETIIAYNNPLKVIDVDFTKLKNLSWLNLKYANCINFWADNSNQVQEAQRLINQNCTRTTQN